MQIRGRGLSREIEIGRDDHFLGIFPLNSLDQFANLQAIRSNALDRGNRPVQDVIATSKLSSPLESNDVQWFFDNTNGTIPSLVHAYRTRVSLGCIEAIGTEAYPLLDIEDRLRE
jgi:hypothetical protein